MNKLKLEESVKKENINIIIGSFICSLVVALVMFAVYGFDYTIITGALWAVLITEVNFYLMSLAVQQAMDGRDEEAARKKIQQSYMIRMGIYMALFVIGAVLPWIHWLPVLLSVFYVRIIVTVRGLIIQKQLKDNPEIPDPNKAITDDEDGEEDEFEKAIHHFGEKTENKMKEEAPEIFGDRKPDDKDKEKNQD